MKTINEKTPGKSVPFSAIESSEVVRIDFNNLKRDLSGFVRGTVEEALNGLLDAEAIRRRNSVSTIQIGFNELLLFSKESVPCSISRDSHKNS